jgi:hypothetical protein
MKIVHKSKDAEIPGIKKIKHPVCSVPSPKSLMDHLLKRAMDAEKEADRYKDTCSNLNDYISILQEKIDVLNLQLSAKRLHVKY